MDKSCSGGRGRAKQKGVDSLTSSCPNSHTCKQHPPENGILWQLYIKDPRCKPCWFFSFPPNSVSCILTSVSMVPHTCSLPLDALKPTWSFRALLQPTCELRMPRFPAQRWQRGQGVLSWWQRSENTSRAFPSSFPLSSLPSAADSHPALILCSSIPILFKGWELSPSWSTGGKIWWCLLSRAYDKHVIIFTASPDGANLSEDWNKLSGWNTSRILSTKQFY